MSADAFRLKMPRYPKPRWRLTLEISERLPRLYLPIPPDIDVRFAPLLRLHQPPRPPASLIRDERRPPRILPACWFQSSLVSSQRPFAQINIVSCNDEIFRSALHRWTQPVRVRCGPNQYENHGCWNALNRAARLG